MEIKLKVEKTFDVKYLLAEIGVRYWEDTEVNEIVDEDGTLIPLRYGEYWNITIDIETGQILDWPKGTTANTHYKSCDDNIFKLLDKDKNIIIEREGYVIDSLDPYNDSYGDYVILKIDGNGFIDKFKFKPTDFVDDED